MMVEGAGPQLAERFPAVVGVGESLRRRGWTVAVAESCTGGLLGAALTAVPGSSDYVRGGVIAYANEVKERLLGVDRRLLDAHGAVSDEVARAMAEGVRERLGADVGVGVTGVAGPGSGEGRKPAGLVYVAVATADGTEAQRLQGDGGREGNRAAAVQEALRMLAALA